MIGILLQLAEGIHHGGALDILGRQAGGLAGRRVGQRGQAIEAGRRLLGVRMAEGKLPPLRMPVFGPALRVAGQLDDLLPADRLVRPAQRLGHRPPHGEAGGDVDNRGALPFRDLALAPVLQELVGLVDPTDIARAPQHRLAASLPSRTPCIISSGPLTCSILDLDRTPCGGHLCVQR